ncbi:MAG: aminopeptidase [Thermodesulfobacteriota bacterium]
MRIVKRFLLLCFLLSSMACGDVLYLSRLGWHQSYVTFHSVSVEEVLRSEEADPLTKERIRFIQEVKRYGEERLGLKKTKNYSTFFEARDPVLYVITASEKDRLHPYSWDFPIVGKVTYKSFFRIEEAMREKRLLDWMGYDTFLQPVAAYSTLGWLRDPIFSTMLEWNESILAQVILHEMVHVTVYYKDETDLNEQIATFVGNRGAIDFLTERYGPGSKEVALAIASQEDDLLISRWIDRTCQRLSDFYEQPISRDEKLRKRDEIFRLVKQEFSDISGQLRIDCYKRFETIELNNAVLLAYRRYVHHLDRFGAIYEYFGKDLKRMVMFFKEVKASREPPNVFLERWMKEKGVTVPSSQR